MTLNPILACAVLLCALPVQAARPLQTDDAGLIPPGACELEGSHTRVRAAGLRVPEYGTAAGCGIGWNSQLGLAYADARSAGQKTRGLALLGKTGLWAGPGDGAPSVAAAWALGWERAAGAGWERVGSEIRLIGTLPLGAAMLHANLGHLRERPSGFKATTWGLALESVELPVGQLRWAPLAEVHGDDRGDRWTAAGVRLTLLPERLYLDLAHARQHRGDKARTTTAGFRLGF
jgi:hypothetical protein